jgi:DNA-binding transcriptional ArsR family regulator
VSEIAEPFGLAQPTVVKHVRVLEDAGLIQQARDAQQRPRRLVVGWLRPFREPWERRFDALVSLLVVQQQRTTRTTRTKGRPR